MKARRGGLDDACRFKPPMRRLAASAGGLAPSLASPIAPKRRPPGLPYTHSRREPHGLPGEQIAGSGKPAGRLRQAWK